MNYVIAILAVVGAASLYEKGKRFIRRYRFRKSGIAKKQFMQEAYIWGKELEAQNGSYTFNKAVFR